MSTQTGPPHLLRRVHIYNDMMELSKNTDIVMQHPFRVHFEGEMGIDTGGLTREAFSALWEKISPLNFHCWTFASTALRANCPRLFQ
jgi:hypothetical protein